MFHVLFQMYHDMLQCFILKRDVTVGLGFNLF